MKANFTLGNINPNFVAGINNIASKAYILARCEEATKALKAYIKEGKDTGVLRCDISDTLNIELGSVEDMLHAIAMLKKDVNKVAKDKASNLIGYYIDPTFSLSEGDIYHNFDAEAFLRNIGLISEGTLKSNKVKKVEAFSALVVDRKKAGYADRFNGTDYITISEDKDIKNNPLTFLLAILEGMYQSELINRTFEENAEGLRTSAFVYSPKQATATEADEA